MSTIRHVAPLLQILAAAHRAIAMATPMRSGRHLALALPIVLAISVLYLFMASAGTFDDLRRQSRYDLMADGFQRGHLYIAQRPSPKLLAQEDPFHPDNKPLWMWDATLYQGRIYLY